MEISYWQLFILLPINLGVFANSTDVNAASKNVSDVESTTRRISNNIMKLNFGIRLPAINTSLSKSPEIGNSSSLLHHWRKHIHHNKRHRKSLENPRKHHIASLLPQKNNLSLVLPMNWPRNRLSISPPSINDPKQVFTNLIHRIINLNNYSSVLSSHSPLDYNPQTINVDTNISFNVTANHTTNNSGIVTLKIFNESHTIDNITGDSANQSCNDDHLLKSSVYKTSESFKDKLTTPHSLLDPIKILTKSANNFEAPGFNQQLKDNSFLKILDKKPLLSVSEDNYATTKSNFIIIDDLGFFGDSIEESPIIKSREVFHPRPSLIDYILGENIDNSPLEIENRNKYVDFLNLETTKNKTIDPGMFKIKFKVSRDIDDHHFLPWKFDNDIYSSKISKPLYNSQMNKKEIKGKVQDRFIPLRSIKQPKSKILNESDFQSAFLSTFYISIAICGVFFAIAVWWRRFSIIKKSNFTTISDSVHTSSTPTSPLAARRPGQSRV